MDHIEHGSGSRSQAGTRLSLRHVSNIVCNCNKGTSVPLNKPWGVALFVASSRDTNTDERKHPPNTPCTVMTPAHSSSHLVTKTMNDFDMKYIE